MTEMKHRSPLLIALVGLLTSAACAEVDDQEASAVQVSKGVETTAQAAIGANALLKIPPELERIIAERRKACGGKLGAQFGKTLTADFNADGKTDHILSEAHFLCADDEGAQSGWGRAGPQNEFLVSTPTGYSLTNGFGHYLTASDIKKRSSGDVLQFDWEDMSSEGCAGKYTVTWSWTGKKMDLTDRRNAKGQKVDENGCPASVPSDLPIKLGYYGHAADGCAVALRSHTSGITISEKYWGDIDGDYSLRPIKNLGNGRYRLGEAVDMIRVTGPDTFVAEEGKEYERRFIWCAARAPK